MVNGYVMGLNINTYKLPNLIQNLIDHLLSNSVVPTSIVVSGILFTSYQLFWVKQLSVGASPNLICNIKNVFCLMIASAGIETFRF